MHVAITGDCYTRWVTSLEPRAQADPNPTEEVMANQDRRMNAAAALRYVQGHSRVLANGDVELGGANEDESEIRRAIRSIEAVTGITAEYPPA